MTALEFQLSMGFLIASFTILAIRGGVQDVFRRKQQVAQLAYNHEAVERAKRITAARRDPDKVLVNTKGVPRAIGTGLIGSLMLAGSGTYGQNMLVRVLNLLYLCGLQNLVGSILLIQHDAGQREAFKNQVPACYHRIKYGYSSSWSGGFSNAPTTEVLDCIDEWGGPLRRAAEDAAYWHEQWTGRVPGQIIFFWSEGGQAPVALPVIEVLHKKFPRAQLVGMTSLPDTSRNRRKFVELKREYEQRGVVGWVVTDKLQKDWKNADYCMAVLLVGLSDAQLHDDETTQLNNVLALTFTEQPGSVLILHYVYERVVAYEWRVEGELLGYWVDEQRLVSTAQAALRDIEQGRGACSTLLPIGEPGTAIFDLVMASVGYDARHDRDDLQTVSDRVEEGYRERLAQLSRADGRDDHPGLLYGLADYDLKFGSLATVINEQQPACLVIALRLAAVQDGGNIAERIADVPPDRLLPHERQWRLLASYSNEESRGGKK